LSPQRGQWQTQWPLALLRIPSNRDDWFGSSEVLGKPVKQEIFLAEADRKEAIMTGQNPGNRFYQERRLRRLAKKRSQQIFSALERGQEDMMAKTNAQMLVWATESKRTLAQLRAAYQGFGLAPAVGAPAPTTKSEFRTAVVSHLNGLPPQNVSTWQPPAPPRRPNRPAPVPVRRNTQFANEYLTGGAVAFVGLAVLGFLIWALFLRPVKPGPTVVQTVEKEVVRTVEVLVTVQPVQPRPTEEEPAPAQPAPATGGSGAICSAYKVDFPFFEGNPGNVIDFRSPRERMVGNFWKDGKEVTYVTGRGIVIRAFFIGYGNYWKFPDDCDFENLVERAIQYAKDTTSSNHTGEVYLVNPDGSLSLITNDAFGYDLTVVPEDPTK